MIELQVQEVRAALAEVGITGPVAVPLTARLNELIGEKVQAVLMQNDPLNVLLREAHERGDC